MYIDNKCCYRRYSATNLSWPYVMQILKMLKWIATWPNVRVNMFNATNDASICVGGPVTICKDLKKFIPFSSQRCKKFSSNF